MTNTRNRWLYTAGAAVACAAVLVTANVAFADRNPAPTAPAFQAAGPGSEEPSEAPSEEPSEAAPPAESPATAVIPTGIKAGGGEWVLYSKPIKDAAIPKTTFGVMLGLSKAGGKPQDAVMTNETGGSDRAPGFHAVQGGMEIDLGKTPTFGYYVGPAAKITGKVGGKKVTASRAPLDAKTQVFWFDATDLRDLAAFDATGKKLPTGNSGVGVG